MKVILAISLFFLMACDNEKSADSSVVEQSSEISSDSPILLPTPQEEATAPLSYEEIEKMNIDYCKEPVSFCMGLCNNNRQKQYLFFDSTSAQNRAKMSEIISSSEGCQKWCLSDMSAKTGCSYLN